MLQLREAITNILESFLSQIFYCLIIYIFKLILFTQELLCSSYSINIIEQKHFLSPQTSFIMIVLYSVRRIFNNYLSILSSGYFQFPAIRHNAVINYCASISDHSILISIICSGVTNQHFKTFNKYCPIVLNSFSVLKTKKKLSKFDKCKIYVSLQFHLHTVFQITHFYSCIF